MLGARVRLGGLSPELLTQPQVKQLRSPAFEVGTPLAFRRSALQFVAEQRWAREPVRRRAEAPLGSCPPAVGTSPQVEAQAAGTLADTAVETLRKTWVIMPMSEITSGVAELALQLGTPAFIAVAGQPLALTDCRSDDGGWLPRTAGSECPPHRDAWRGKFHE